MGQECGAESREASRRVLKHQSARTEPNPFGGYQSCRHPRTKIVSSMPRKISGQTTLAV